MSVHMCMREYICMRDLAIYSISVVLVSSN